MSRAIVLVSGALALAGCGVSNASVDGEPNALAAALTECRQLSPTGNPSAKVGAQVGVSKWQSFAREDERCSVGLDSSGRVAVVVHSRVAGDERLIDVVTADTIGTRRSQRFSDGLWRFVDSPLAPASEQVLAAHETDLTLWLLSETGQARQATCLIADGCEESGFGGGPTCESEKWSAAGAVTSAVMQCGAVLLSITPAKGFMFAFDTTQLIVDLLNSRSGADRVFALMQWAIGLIPAGDAPQCVRDLHSAGISIALLISCLSQQGGAGGGGSSPSPPPGPPSGGSGARACIDCKCGSWHGNVCGDTTTDLIDECFSKC